MSRALILLIGLLLISACSRENLFKFPDFERVLNSDGTFAHQIGHLTPEDRVGLSNLIKERDTRPICCAIEYGKSLYVFTGEQKGTLYKCQPTGIDSFQIESLTDWSGDPFKVGLNPN